MDDADIFVRIQTAAKKLNASADKATAYLKSVEERLISASIGIEIIASKAAESRNYLSDSEGASIELHEDRRVGLAKVGDKWRLVMRVCTYRVTKNDEWGGDDWLEQERRDHPLLDLSRQARIKAVPFIPPLLLEIASAAEEAVTAVERVVSTLPDETTVKEAPPPADEPVKLRLRPPHKYVIKVPKPEGSTS